MIRRPPRSTRVRSSAASDVYKRQNLTAALCPVNPRAKPARAARWEYHMAERSLRGTNLSALSMETDTNVVLSERQIVRYICPEKHISELPFSVEADVPSVWECRCGLEARLVDGPDPEYKNVKAVRTHWDMPVSYTHLRAHETVLDLVCRLLLEK